MNINLSRLTLTLLVCLLTIASGYPQKKLLILGSSTSACWGPTNPANCYVNRLASYYNTPTPMITIDNRAAGGFNVYKSMPRSYKAPANRDTSLPWYSITDALAANPDVILVNYPTNNYDVYSVQEVMFCLRTIKATANKAGKLCYITTTQPRTGFDAAGREKLRILKDSILNQFGPSAIDFFTGLADPLTLAIAAPYQVAGDLIHMNDDAHNVLYQRVLGKNIFNALLPDAGPDLTITLPATAVLDGSNSVVPGTVTGYSWTKVSGPTSGIIDAPTSASSTLSGLVAGTYTFRLTVKDERGVTTSDDVVVTVKEGIGTPPSAQAGPDQSITLPVNSVVVDGSKSTSTGSTINSYNWSYVSGPTVPAIATPAAASTSINNLAQGVYIFRLTVTNTSGLASTDDIQITVNPAISIQPPMANAGKDETIPEGQATVLHGETSIAPGGAIKSYLWTKVSGPANLEMLTPTASSTWIRSMTAGVYVFRLTITDTNGLTASDDVVITVTAIAPAPVPASTPVAQAGPDVSITLPVSYVTLDGSASTAPGSLVSKYNWSFVSGPAGYYIATPIAVKTDIKNLVQGVYTFRLTVTNTAGLTAFDDVVITVKPAPVNPPIANAGNDETIPVGQATVLHGESSSAANGIRSYAWSKYSGPDVYEMLTPTASNTWIRNLVAGTYVFGLTITDNTGVTAFDAVTITVLPLAAPIAAAGADIQLTAPTSSVTLDGRKSTSSQGVISNYNWRYISGPLGATIVSPDSAITKVNGLVVGVYTFRLTVTNSLGNKGYDDVVVYVNSALLVAPATTTTANAGKDETIPPGQATVLHGENSSAPGGQIVSYLWTKYSGPLTCEILTPNAATTWIRNMVSGTYVYRLTVTDDKGIQASDDVVITVTGTPVTINRDNVNQLSVNNRDASLNQPGFHIYPNPAVHYLNVELNQPSTGSGKIFITDASGRRVKMISFVKEDQVYSKQIEVAGLKAGSYSVEIYINRERLLSRKFFKY